MKMPKSPANDDLDDFLDIETPEVEIIPPSNNDELPIAANTSNEDAAAEADFAAARQNLLRATELGAEAMEEMLAIAKQTQQPRAFEVVGSLMKTVADANKDILDLRGKKQELKGETPSKKRDDSPKNVTNNVLFAGSTKDLQKAMKRLMNNNTESNEE